MNRRRIRRLTTLAVLSFGATVTAGFTVTWSTIDGGGGTSSGATFQVEGTIGQPDAGAAAGANWAVAGGYYAGGATLPSCPEDLDGSGDVGFSDLVAVLSTWGSCGGCPEDLDGSGDVGFSDLVALLAAWGPC